MLGSIFNLSFLITALQAATVNIAIGKDNSLQFSPRTAYATVGDLITFTWFTGRHNVVQSSNIRYCDSAIPGGITSGPPVDEPGKEFSFTVTEPGSIYYFCQVYCTDDMRGEIIVSEPTGGTTTATETTTETITTETTTTATTTVTISTTTTEISTTVTTTTEPAVTDCTATTTECTATTTEPAVTDCTATTTVIETATALAVETSLIFPIMDWDEL